MSVQRTPPNATMISGSESASGSVPNLSTHSDIDYYVTNRKRKERTDVHECKNDFISFRNDMMKFLENFGKSQNENLSLIREEISEVKKEIQTIKSATENFTQQFKNMNMEMQQIKSDNNKIQDRIKQIENELRHVKSQSTENSITKSSSDVYEDIILELKERCDREKNIVIVGVSEINDKNYRSRRKHDDEEVLKLLKMMYEDCPQPKKCIRLGKYIPNKNRPIKAYFNNSEMPKILLRNKIKLPENIQLYSDQTRAQALYLQSLKMELNKRFEDGEKDLIIKYIKGIPKIIQNKTVQKN